MHVIVSCFILQCFATTVLASALLIGLSTSDVASIEDHEQPFRRREHMKRRKEQEEENERDYLLLLLPPSVFKLVV